MAPSGILLARKKATAIFNNDNLSDQGLYVLLTATRVKYEWP